MYGFQIDDLDRLLIFGYYDRFETPMEALSRLQHNNLTVTELTIRFSKSASSPSTTSDSAPLVVFAFAYPFKVAGDNAESFDSEIWHSYDKGLL